MKQLSQLQAGANGPDLDWWRGAAIYQIYPRSYQDSNGDGVGDLLGIVQRLPYIASLGVDAIWISPFFTSPMKDFGYDVSDYCDVDPIFGTLADFDTLIKQAHHLGLRVMIDLVLSHTSGMHPWFVQSRQDRTNPKADWFVWADPKDDGTPPNNWLSIFGGSAWQWDARREQYYLHNFLISQPDLNFHNVDVQDALLDVVRFWLDRGVDGFRLDTINFYYADKDLRDNPPLPKDKRNATIAPSVNPYNHQDHVYSKNQPENLEFLERFRAVLDQYPGTTCVGEVGDAQRGLEILGEYTDGDHRVHMCYAFELLSGARPTAQFIAETFGRLDAAAPDGWACWAYSNHDVKRHATRWDLSHEAQKLFHMLMVCLRGSLCLYQGEELGLPEADVPFDLLQDPYGIEFWPEYKGRDGCRTPMVWERSNHHAGFSTAQTSWLPVPANHLEHAVEVQEANENALIHHYRRALKLRHRFDALRIGDQGGMVANGDVLTFTRRHNGQEVFCAFNLGDTEVTLSAPAGSWAGIGADIGAAEIGPNGTITLQGWQACIAEKQT